MYLFITKLKVFLTCENAQCLKNIISGSKQYFKVMCWQWYNQNYLKSQISILFTSIWTPQKKVSKNTPSSYITMHFKFATGNQIISLRYLI